MGKDGAPQIEIERINVGRCSDLYEAVQESRAEWSAAGLLDGRELTMDDVLLLVQGYVTLWNDGDAYMFYVLDQATADILGMAFLNQVDPSNQIASLGYMVRSARTGKGIATEAARRVAVYGFEKLGLRRIELVADEANAASLRIAEKLGATREGLLRNRLLVNGKSRQAYLYSLIPADLGVGKSG
jgi:ribosomal-protein-serine acetyltransferase